VCAGQPASLADLRRLLTGGGHDARGHVIGAPEPDLGPGVNLVIVDGSGCAPAALDLCRQLRSRVDEEVVPILYVTDAPQPAARVAGFEAGADTCLLRPFAA